MRFSRSRATLLLSAGAAAALSEVVAAREPERPSPALTWEPEIRCCWTYDDLEIALRGVFIVRLFGDTLPVGHLKLVTPTGAVIGYDERTKLFVPPTPEGVYGLGPDIAPPETMPDPVEHRSTPRTLALFSRVPGVYRLHVVGERAGSYSLELLVKGLQQTGPGVLNSIVDRHFVNVPIKAGEIHVYVFPGEYGDPTLGSVPAEKRFRVTRLK